MPSGLGPTWWLCGLLRRLRGVPEGLLAPPTGSPPGARGPLSRWKRAPQGSRRVPASLGPEPLPRRGPRPRESRNS
eukprot:8487822-Pyramimonas_sp.AAC.1